MSRPDAGSGAESARRGWRVSRWLSAWRASIEYRRAVALQRAGKGDEALHCCERILSWVPDHFEALHLSGVLEARRGRFDDALARMAAAVASNPRSAEAQANRANVLKLLRRPVEARDGCDAALAINPDLGFALSLRESLKKDLDGHAAMRNGEGAVLMAAKEFEPALACFDLALAAKPDLPEALNNRGAVQRELGHFDEALASLDRALAVKPGFVDALNNRGLVLQEQKRFDEALASFDQALALKPDTAEALNNRGAVRRDMGHFAQALDDFDRALFRRPDFVGALINRGVTLRHLKRYAEALPSIDRALALEPGVAAVLHIRAAVLASLGRHDEAIPEYERALERDPGMRRVKVALLHSKMFACDWRAYRELTESVIADVRLGEPGVNPFTFLAISDSPRDLQRCAQAWVRDEFPPSPSPLSTGERYRHPRIRVAYLSADYRDHATSHLIAGLFECHDRERFEVTGISFGPDARDPMRARVEVAFERFVDVRQRSDEEVAKLLRDLEIDIAVDLGGFTTDCRSGIVARRPAPIQVSYLGFPGTMGADYIDYLIADAFVLPPEDEPWFNEKVVTLPDSYQVNDAKRQIAPRTPSRAQAGLPESGFVFCSFNNNYKITPPLFEVWMRLLREVDGSVLWLLEGNKSVPGNLRREAQSRGVAPERLVFAPKVGHADHLARHRLADLLLDSLPYNAHTTASDALWAGLPVLTCRGNAFAGRVAASLLHAVGLPELVTASTAEYEALAQRLARDAEALAAIKAKLAQHRDRCPLFDTRRFARHIEAAYLGMWERWQRGEPPSAFSVAPID
ncbi:MAG: tetratricopeptide repeat protein [Betaproteobacteria bacterium]